MEVLLLGAGLPQGLTIQLPRDVLCEASHVDPPPGEEGAPAAEDPAPAAEGEEGAPADETISILPALEEAAKYPISLGSIESGEVYAQIDATTAQITMRLGSPGEAEANPRPINEPKTLEDGTVEEVSQLIPSVPANCMVGDHGEATREAIVKTLGRCRGVLWNGALGQIDVAEKWQIGTRNFLSTVESRMTGPDEDEEEEEEEEEEGEDEEGGEKKVKEEKEEDADFEVSIVIGKDSSKAIGSMMDNAGTLSYVSQYGEAVVQMIRGKKLPGLVALAEKKDSASKTT